jgi:UDP-N-acetylmuramate dehydrogenase
VSSKQHYVSLRALVRGDLKINEPMAPFTTWGVGGEAEFFFIPKDAEDLAAALAFCSSQALPYFILGAGSNILVSDRGIAGLVIKLKAGFNYLKLKGEVVCAGSAVSLNRLVRFCERHSLTGLEFCAGIPGSLGGSLAVNAGAWGKSLGDLVQEVEILTFEGQRQTLHRNDFTHSYRKSNIKDMGIILGATLKLAWGNQSEISEQIKVNIAYRHKKHPWKEKSAGSVFKNPYPEYAWSLINAVGGTGKKLGGAQFSVLHSNFIINTGNATAEDIWKLMNWARNEVKKKFNIELEPEIIRVGRW